MVKRKKKTPLESFVRAYKLMMKHGSADRVKTKDQRIKTICEILEKIDNIIPIYYTLSKQTYDDEPCRSNGTWHDFYTEEWSIFCDNVLDSMLKDRFFSAVWSLFHYGMKRETARKFGMSADRLSKEGDGAFDKLLVFANSYNTDPEKYKELFETFAQILNDTNYKNSNKHREDKLINDFFKYAERYKGEDLEHYVHIIHWINHTYNPPYYHKMFYTFNQDVVHDAMEGMTGEKLEKYMWFLSEIAKKTVSDNISSEEFKIDTQKVIQDVIEAANNSRCGKEDFLYDMYAIVVSAGKKPSETADIINTALDSIKKGDISNLRGIKEYVFTHQGKYKYLWNKE